jgi:hypothetical protein
MGKSGLILILGLLLFGFVSGASVSDDILEKFNDGEELVSVIVTEGGALRTSGLSIMGASDSGIERIVERGDKYTALISREELEILLGDSNVLNIQRNIPLKTFMQDVVGTIQADDSWNLKVDGINLTGASNSVCILDTGINASHPDFSGRVLAEKCYCSISDSGGGGCCPDGTGEQNNSAIDDYGHGTHVAGIVGASGGINGVAMEARLVIVKIMNATGAGWSIDLDDGIQWCIDNADTYNISVITASLGGDTKYTSTCDNIGTNTVSKINAAVTAGISVTIATGNDGYSDGITWPSCISTAIPVGATDKSDNIASYSNRGSILKLFGIGGTSASSSTQINSTNYLGGYTGSQGTSMATPVVAGAIAILNQVLNLTTQSMTPSEIETNLFDNGQNISEPGNNYSRINLYESILSIDNIAPNTTLSSPSNNTIDLSANQSFVCNTTDWQLSNITFNLWNSSGALIYNETQNISGVENETTFNYTNISEGDYEWNCEAYDSENNLGISSSNFSLTVGGVEVSLDSPGNNSYTNLNATNFTCTSSSDADYGLDNITFSLWNSSGVLIYNETRDISGATNETVFNYTFIEEDDYEWECLAINNNSDEAGGINFSVSYDLTYPNITIDPSTSVTTSSATLTWTTNEETNTSIISDSNVTNASFSTSHSQAISGLSASTSYNYNITYCDRAGNCNSTDGSFTTSTPSPSGGSTGGGTSSGGAGAGKTLYSASMLEISSGYTKDLRSGSKINFSVSVHEEERHLLTVNSVNLTYASITVESSPITLLLNIGESAKLSLESENYYDLLVTLNNITNNKASITLQLISEEIVAIPIHTFDENETAEEEDAFETSPLMDYFWIGLLVVLVFILIASLIKGIHYEIKGPKKIKGSKSNKKNGSRRVPSINKEDKNNGKQNKKAKASAKRKR